jgi:GntR family transcriptional regulator
MEFILDPHSPLPAHLQIEEQIKLALLLGRLRPGDTLPSIRDAERQTHISRNIVRNAYLALQHSGILTLRHGKGVLVEKQLSYSNRGSIMEQCQALSAEVLAHAERLRISPSAFARYLYQQALDRERTEPSVIFVDATKALASERATKISAFWHLNVPGYSLDELKILRKNKLQGIRTILTNYLRLDQVLKILKPRRADVIPLSLTFSSEMRDVLRRLPSNAEVALILADRDYPSRAIFLESYGQLLVNPSIKLTTVPRSRIKDLERFVKSTQYQKVIISNRIWDEVPESVKKHPRVTRAIMEIDLTSLESARIRAGVVL